MLILTPYLYLRTRSGICWRVESEEFVQHKQVPGTNTGVIMLPESVDQQTNLPF